MAENLLYSARSPGSVSGTVRLAGEPLDRKDEFPLDNWTVGDCRVNWRALPTQLALILVLAFRVVGACQPQEQPPNTPLEDLSTDRKEEESLFDHLIQQLVHDAVPRRHETRKDWGRTIEVVSGLNVRREGLELRTSRRRKEVPHGHWQLVRLELADPQQDLDIQLLRPRQSDKGLLFDIEATARLQTFARYMHWRYGVHLLSVSGDAEAVVQLHATCEIALQLDAKRLPPDVLVVPRIHEAEIRLVSLDLRRLSHLRGDLAQELGRLLRRVLNDVLEKRQDRLTDRMNQQLAKKQDRLRLSLYDLAASRWNSILQTRPPSSEAGSSEAGKQ
jgi:hypothetical protein